MKKITINFITVALFLSISVHAAPVAHNNNAVAQDAGVEHRVDPFGFAIVLGGVVAFIGAGVIGGVIQQKQSKKKLVASRKKKAKAALRKRAEAEYAHRHMPHKWRMLQP
jgi:hypothetical protein